MQTGSFSPAGGCQCGAVRFTVTEPPQIIYVCHCRKCRKQSASAFGISVIVPRAALRVTHGTPAHWSCTGDSGRRFDCAFCPACGTRLWHAGEGNATISIKGGALDEPPGLQDAVHIWTSRKLLGVIIPEGAQRFPEEPDARC
jgi:hypothetical protein